MKFVILALCVVIVLRSEHALARMWQPTPGHTQVPIWPGTPPDTKPMPGQETEGQTASLVAGKPWTWVANVAQPTMTIYAPKGKNTGAAVVVLPGGGFEVLA